ncbi:MAG TPA: OB-fold nucleic acid binding domain-containing protein, partial [Thermoanaerobaculia bacterium]|nr:OB-fold nucleic acid binding domain-containing protein [Thermoanaerobaculia bacterium]
YQEQVMQIAVEVAGFTMAEADVLRKAMGKKKLEVMEEQKERFAEGASARGVDRRKARELWDYIEPFAGYGFNKSHSVAYAMLAYKTAFLKAHYPVAFMAAMLNSELSSSDAVGKYLRECQAMGIDVLPPDLNESGWAFTVVGQAIRFGLGAVKGVGEGAVEAVLEARRAAGRFESLAHFASSVDLKSLNHKVFESLIKAGCFDTLGVARAALWAGLDPVLGWAVQRQRDQEAGQGALFGGAQGAVLEPAPDASVPEWPDRERLSYEKEALGFYLTGNPLSEHEASLERLTTHTVEEVLTEGVEGSVVLGGLVTRLKQAKIKSGVNAGRLMARFVLEDLTGRVPVTLFASQTEQFGHLLEDEAVVIVRGEVRERGSEKELAVEEMQSLERAVGPPVLEVTIAAPASPAKLKDLKELILEHPGKSPVRLCVRNGGSAARRVSLKLLVDATQRPAIERLLGAGSVRETYEAPAAVGAGGG